MDKIVEKKIREVKAGETLIAALDGKRSLLRSLRTIVRVLCCGATMKMAVEVVG